VDEVTTPEAAARYAMKMLAQAGALKDSDILRGVMAWAKDGAQLPRLQSGDSLSVQRRLTEIVEKSDISSAATRSRGCTPSTPKSKVQTPKRPWSEGGELVAGKVGLQGLPMVLGSSGEAHVVSCLQKMSVRGRAFSTRHGVAMWQKSIGGSTRRFVLASSCGVNVESGVAEQLKRRLGTTLFLWKVPSRKRFVIF